MATENNTEIPCTLFTLIYRIDLHVKSLSPFNLWDLGRGNNIFKLLVAAGLSWVHTENEYSYDVTFLFLAFQFLQLLQLTLLKNGKT